MLLGTVAHGAAPTPPDTIGEAVVLIDADTKEILFSKNPDKWMHRQVLRNGNLINST